MSLRIHSPCTTLEATMPSMKTFALSFLASVLAIHAASAFVANPASVPRVSSKNINNRVTLAAFRKSSYKLASKKSLGSLHMAEGDAMEAAQATAKKLNDQAAALREAAASSEADIRPPAKEVEVDESATTAEAAPEVRPEDLPPKQKISDDMKARLRKELTSQGADPNKSAGNPILIVAAVIAVLVVVGGQGIFY